MNKRIEYYSQSDSQGRCSFSLHWMDDYFPGHPDGEHVRRERGQHFFSDPRSYGFSRPEEVERNKKNRKSVTGSSVDLIPGDSNSQFCHVAVDGVRVGMGRKAECEALADELRVSKRKAGLVKSMFA